MSSIKFDVFLSCDLTYLSDISGWNWHLAHGQVVKASPGHIPQPFWISNKELVQR